MDFGVPVYSKAAALMASVGSYAAAAGTQQHSAAGPMEGLMGSQPPGALQVQYTCRELLSISQGLCSSCCLRFRCIHTATDSNQLLAPAPAYFCISCVNQAVRAVASDTNCTATLCLCC